MVDLVVEKKADSFDLEVEIDPFVKLGMYHLIISDQIIGNTHIATVQKIVLETNEMNKNITNTRIKRP